MGENRVLEGELLPARTGGDGVARREDEAEHEAALMLSHSLGLEHAASPSALRAAVRARLADLVKTDRAGLIQLLYRIDVAESEAARALATPGLDAALDALTTVVLDRQFAKIRYRIETAARVRNALAAKG